MFGATTFIRTIGRRMALSRITIARMKLGRTAFGRMTLSSKESNGLVICCS